MARKVTYDQEKVKELRMEIILASLYVLNDGDVTKWSQYKRDLILRYAPKVLPQLNAGRDDNERLIPQPLLSNVLSDDSDKESSTTKEED